MRAVVADSTLTIDLQDLVDSLTPEQRRHFARHLVADKELFAAVLEALSDESGLGSYFEDEEAWWFGSDACLELREKLIPLMPEIARGAVKTALQQRDSARAEAERYRSWAFAMYHAWPVGDWRNRPELPTWTATLKPSDAAVEEFMTRTLTGGQR